MKRVNLFALSLILVLTFAISSAFSAHDEGMQTIEGNVICLLPDYNKGNVKPVIATEPCAGLPAHAHVLVSKDGKVYALEGSEEAMHKLEMSSERKDVKITGRVEGNQRGWILRVE